MKKSEYCCLILFIPLITVSTFIQPINGKMKDDDQWTDFFLAYCSSFSNELYTNSYYDQQNNPEEIILNLNITELENMKIYIYGWTEQDDKDFNQIINNTGFYTYDLIVNSINIHGYADEAQNLPNQIINMTLKGYYQLDLKNNEEKEWIEFKHNGCAYNSWNMYNSGKEIYNITNHIEITGMSSESVLILYYGYQGSLDYVSYSFDYFERGNYSDNGKASSIVLDFTGENGSYVKGKIWLEIIELLYKYTPGFELSFLILGLALLFKKKKKGKI